MTLSDPQLVARDYASEQGLLARRSLWASDPGAREPWDVALEAVVEASLVGRRAEAARAERVVALEA